MFQNNFNFKNEKELISDEIKRLVSQTGNPGQRPSSDECNYLTIWKQNLLKLSGNN